MAARDQWEPLFVDGPPDRGISVRDIELAAGKLRLNVLVGGVQVGLGGHVLAHVAHFDLRCAPCGPTTTYR